VQDKKAIAKARGLNHLNDSDVEHLVERSYQ